MDEKLDHLRNKVFKTTLNRVALEEGMLKKISDKSNIGGKRFFCSYFKPGIKVIYIDFKK